MFQDFSTGHGRRWLRRRQRPVATHRTSRRCGSSAKVRTGSLQPLSRPAMGFPLCRELPRASRRGRRAVQAGRRRARAGVARVVGHGVVIALVSCPRLAGFASGRGPGGGLGRQAQLVGVPGQKDHPMLVSHELGDLHAGLTRTVDSSANESQRCGWAAGRGRPATRSRMASPSTKLRTRDPAGGGDPTACTGPSPSQRVAREHEPPATETAE
jgi:hypothetical protein